MIVAVAGGVEKVESLAGGAAQRPARGADHRRGHRAPPRRRGAGDGGSEATCALNG